MLFSWILVWEYFPDHHDNSHARNIHTLIGKKSFVQEHETII